MVETPELLKVVGPVTWCTVSDDCSGHIKRGVFRDRDDLVLDVLCGADVYLVKLRRTTGDQFEGSWESKTPRTLRAGVASAVVYTSSVGRLLFGSWVEDELKYQWWAELSVVEHFPDEDRR